MAVARDRLAGLADEALLVLYRQGDPHAARALTERLVPGLLGYATRLLGERSEAEDAVQDAMLRLWRAAPEGRAGAPWLRAWLFRVVGNLCIDRHRRARRRPALPLEGAAEPEGRAAAGEELALQAERMRALDAALAALPDRQRQAVVLRHIEGMTNPEIADILQIGVAAVESLTARGKRALAAALGEGKAGGGRAGGGRAGGGSGDRHGGY